VTAKRNCQSFWNCKDLSAHRVRAGLTQRQLAAVVGRSPDSIRAYEHARAVPPVTVAAAIAAALGVELGDLLSPGGGGST